MLDSMLHRGLAAMVLLCVIAMSTACDDGGAAPGDGGDRGRAAEGDGAESDGAAAGTDAAAGDALDGTSWRLVEIVGETLPAEAKVTLEFREGRAAGNAAVNRYSTGYTANAVSLSFAEQAISTKMAGPEPLMKVEQRYLELLRIADRRSIEGDRLTLHAGDAAVLVFERAD